MAKRTKKRGYSRGYSMRYLNSKESEIKINKRIKRKKKKTKRNTKNITKKRKMKKIMRGGMNSCEERYNSARVGSDRLNKLDSICQEPLCSVYEFSNCKKIGFIGATTNFFKLGFTTIQHIMNIDDKQRPRISLGLPEEVKETPAIVRHLTEGSNPNFEFKNWKFGSDKNTELESLTEFFSGCSDVFLVPPIQDRLKYGELYINAVINANVKRAILIGVQYTKAYCDEIGIEQPAIGVESEKLYSLVDSIVSNRIKESDTEFDFKVMCLNVPMFLENIMYQYIRLKEFNALSIPQHIDSKFAYISCEDVGVLAANVFKDFENVIEKFPENINIGYKYENYIRYEMIFSTGVTSYREFINILSSKTGNPYTYIRQSDDSFINELMVYLHKDRQYANQILDFHKLIDKGKDIIDTKYIMTKEDLGIAELTDLEKWITDRIPCFTSDYCPFPLPPANHVAPAPLSDNIIEFDLG